MRKEIFVLLVAANLCSIFSEIQMNTQILVTQDKIGEVSLMKNDKAYLFYFYSAEKLSLYIDGKYQNQGSIISLQGNGKINLTTKLPIFPQDLPYVGPLVKPKYIPFYFLQLYNDNKLAIININWVNKTAHIPTHLPITYRVEVGKRLHRDYLLSLRGDDISMVESVHLIIYADDQIIFKRKLEANKDNIFTSPFINTYGPDETKLLEIKLIKSEKRFSYENFLQVDILTIFENYDDTATYIDNKPQILSTGQELRKKTQISSFDDFVIEFPEELVELKSTTLSDAVKDLALYVVTNGKIHVTLKTQLPDLEDEQIVFSDPEDYYVELVFFVKRLPKLTDPIIIARYNIEELKNTHGFIIRGNYYDDKIYFKVLSETILNNNIYFAFKNSDALYLISSIHKIAIGYDALPSLEFSEFHEGISGTQIVGLEVNKQRVKNSEFLIICLKREKDQANHKSSLSYFEVKITKDLYKTINKSEEIIEYTLKKGQTIFIINNALTNSSRFFDVDIDYQFCTVNNYEGEVTSYIRKIADNSYKWMHTNLDSLFTYSYSDKFTEYRSLIYKSNTSTEKYPENFSSIIVVTAVTNGASGTIVTGKEKLRHNKTLNFLN